LAAAMVSAVAGLATPTASASGNMLVGIYDEPSTIGRPDWAFPKYKALRVKVLRVNLYWGDVLGVAQHRRPAQPTNPADPAYDWSIYDRTVKQAKENGIQMVFSILWTPRWAGPRKNGAPTRMADLRNFAIAAAKRYSGNYFPIPDEDPLPLVRYWMAWNEPNNPVFLKPQFVRSGSKWVIQSAKDYARMCNAVVKAVKIVHYTNQVACGVTSPRGNNQPGTVRASVSPLAFMRAMKLAGATGFDAYAHHPYYGYPSETPNTKPPLGRHGLPPTAVTLGNFEMLTAELQRLYGNMRIWVTEYGYQTNPPDKTFGVTLLKQAIYMQQAWDKLKANPKVDMMIWFLLRDQTPGVAGGWQSGVYTANGARKPSRETFERLG
jgi:hypothetical protein